MVVVTQDLDRERTPERPTVLDVLRLEQIDRDLYRSTLVFADPFPLYGGQVAAQALFAAGGTVSDDRLPHSLHGYFLRSGDAARPTVFHVDRDRDGRSFSARRVVAVQGGEVIFNMSASFQAPGDGPDHQVQEPPDAERPEDSESLSLPRLFSMEGRRPSQPYRTTSWPTRFWARATVALPPDDHLMHSCVLTYLSDIGTGLSALPDDDAAPGPSLDHAVWFHRHVQLDDWVLMDMRPVTVSGGRGWYAGSVTTADGGLAASFVQETLFRPGPNPFRRSS
jgi:acyl-CoA thioesterase-2